MSALSRPTDHPAKRSGKGRRAGFGSDARKFPIAEASSLIVASNAAVSLGFRPRRADAEGRILHRSNFLVRCSEVRYTSFG
jgi:hypothetical protein